MKSAAVALLAVVALVASPAARSTGVQESLESRDLSKPFSSGGSIYLDLSAGDYTIQGTDEPTIRLSWRTRGERDASRVRMDVRINGSNATVRTRGPGSGFRVQVDVPRRSHLDMTLTAGDLKIRRIEGNKRLSMWAGDVTIEVGEAEMYRRVDATVKAGEISPRPFGRSTGGLFRSFRWDGKGKYTIDAVLFAGDLKLVH